jgi:hypothetical protein
MTARRTSSCTPTDPRVVGGRYHCFCWGIDYTVEAISFGPNGFLESITVTDKDGSRTHATAWDRRDRILFDPRSEGDQS